jgi:bifunctional enzyme CysN/CysC
VKSIVTFDGELEEAFAPQSITLTLEDEIDSSRGDMLVRPGNVPKVDQRFEAMLVWMTEEPLVPGRQYLFKQTSKVVPGAVSTLRYRVDINTLHSQPAPTLALNEIGRCTVTLTSPIAHDTYRRNRTTGGFIMIDRLTNATVAAGMILDREAEDAAADHWDDSTSADHLHAEQSGVTTGAGGAVRSEARHDPAHRPDGVGQVDARQGARKKTLRHGPRRGRPRRSKHAAWHQQGSRLHSSRSQ